MEEWKRCVWFGGFAHPVSDWYADLPKRRPDGLLAGPELEVGRGRDTQHGAVKKPVFKVRSALLGTAYISLSQVL